MTLYGEDLESAIGELGTADIEQTPYGLYGALIQECQTQMGHLERPLDLFCFFLFYIQFVAPDSFCGAFFKFQICYDSRKGAKSSTGMSFVASAYTVIITSGVCGGIIILCPGGCDLYHGLRGDWRVAQTFSLSLPIGREDRMKNPGGSYNSTIYKMYCARRNKEMA